MQPIHDLAIVLRSIPYGDRHKIVTALTEKHGQISALAKNSVQSRRFGGALEPFVASQWIYSWKPGAELAQLSEAEVKEAFEDIRKNFELFSVASALNELMLRLAPQNEACPDLFRLHSNALVALNELAGSFAAQTTLQGPQISLLNAYLAKLLQWCGNQPRLTSCSICGIMLSQILDQILKKTDSEAELSCTIASAGWVCPQCRTQETRHVSMGEREGVQFQHLALRITPLAIVDFHSCLSFPIRKVIPEMKASYQEHQQLFKFLEALFIYHVPGFDKTPIKSLRFLDLESNLKFAESNPPHNSL